MKPLAGWAILRGWGSERIPPSRAGEDRGSPVAGGGGSRGADQQGGVVVGKAILTVEGAVKMLRKGRGARVQFSPIPTPMSRGPLPAGGVGEGVRDASILELPGSLGLQPPRLLRPLASLPRFPSVSRVSGLTSLSSSYLEMRFVGSFRSAPGTLRCHRAGWPKVGSFGDLPPAQAAAGRETPGPRTKAENDAGV